jgi:hypothetical protein
MTKPLYVSRRITNPQDIVDWARGQGFKTTLAPEDLHVTVAYSTAPVDWGTLSARPGPLRIVGGKRSVTRLGDGDAVVLAFQSDALHRRWQAFREAGASWDHEGYSPHITLTYAAGDVDLATVRPYSGPIRLGPERFEVLDENWKDGVQEEATMLVKAQRNDAQDGPPLDAYMDAIRGKLADLGAIQEHARATGVAIRRSADARLPVVQHELDALRPHVTTDDDAARRYRDLTLERGHLHRLLGDIPMS